MASRNEIKPGVEIESWQEDLQKVGFVRRLFQARQWYGADWWFVAVSAVMVLGFIFVALFPQLLAPYSFDDIVGTSFLAPGEYPALPVLITRTDSPTDFSSNFCGVSKSKSKFCSSRVGFLPSTERSSAVSGCMWAETSRQASRLSPLMTRTLRASFTSARSPL